MKKMKGLLVLASLLALFFVVATVGCNKVEPEDSYDDEPIPAEKPWYEYEFEIDSSRIYSVDYDFSEHPFHPGYYHCRYGMYQEVKGIWYYTHTLMRVTKEGYPIVEFPDDYPYEHLIDTIEKHPETEEDAVRHYIN
jgi:hypothetical protein